MGTTEITLKNLAEANNGVFSTEDAARAGINRTILKRYADRNVITRIARGQYAMAGFVPDEFALLQSGSENLIYSYGSAMYFWGLSDRTPHLLEFSVPQGYNTSRIKERDPNVRFHYVKSDIHSLGKTTVKSPQGGEVILYDRERCICDLVRDRNAIDKQLFTHGLKTYFASKPNLRKLLKYGKQFGIDDKLRTYMEVLM